MNQLSVLLIALIALFGNANACSRTVRNPVTGGVIVTNPNNPANAPPTPSPTPPPPPPPIPQGWVPPPPSAQTYQEMGRTNCKKKVKFGVVKADGDTSAASKEDIREVWEYLCTFQVCVEVELTGEKGDCACAMFAGNPSGDTYNNQPYTHYETSIKHFFMVVWDTQSRTSVEPIQGWSFEGNEDVQKNLAEAAEGDMDYSLALSSFAGQVNMLELPSSLNRTIPMNAYNVPAACFFVEQKFTTTTRWPKTQTPVLYSEPSAWATDCAPVYDNNLEQVGVGQPAKRGAAGQRFWAREFLLFPLAESSREAAGFIPKNRYITAFYLNSQCQFAAGYFSIDRRFTSELDHEAHFNIMGAFAWKRTYSSTFIVGGVPRSFGSSAEFWSSGYHRVNWFEPYSRVDGNGAFRTGVVYNALTGSCGAAGSEKFIGCKAEHGVCTQLPADWETCATPGAEGCTIQTQREQYGENAYFYPVTDQVVCPGFVSASCTEETTFLSFQNFGGALARDYNKRESSQLLTGPRLEFCKTYPQLPEFDPIPYKPLTAGAAVSKRSSLRARAEPVYHYTPRGGIEALKDGEDSSFNTPVAEGGRYTELGFRVAIGTVDKQGKPMGDHPLELFPEQYAAPVSLDPNDPDQLDEKATLALAWDGKAPPCIQGTQGCACRDIKTTNRPACDQPLDCQKVDGTDSFCMVPECPVGQQGCDCTEDSSCLSDGLACLKGTCVFDNVCTPGTAGCTAKDGACTDGSLLEIHGDDFICTFRACLLDAPGCPCGPDEVTCAGGSCVQGMCQNATFDEGRFGGRCGNDDACQLGFECEKGTCTVMKCQPGDSGCVCDDNSECKDADAICGEDQRCLKPRCTHGSKGCACANGRCEEGFECAVAEGKPLGRCVEIACDAGDNGCPCAADDKCNNKGFKCLTLTKDGKDKRCMSTGVDCETPRGEFCKEFCGEGNVLVCPPCAGQIPTCEEPTNVGTDASSATLLASGAAVVAALVAALF